MAMTIIVYVYYLGVCCVVLCCALGSYATGMRAISSTRDLTLRSKN
jgi:hypothetical protein